MIVRTQYCVDRTSDVKSKWAVYVAPNHLTIQELFSRILAGKLLLFGLFQNIVYTSGMHFFQSIPIGTPCLKKTVKKSSWFLSYNKCSGYELSWYTYG